MATNKTTENNNSVAAFLATVKDAKKRRDCAELIKLIGKHLGLPAKMWGTAIIGFGSYHYTYESGREGDAPLAGLSPRVNAITVYIADFKGRDKMLLALGKHTVSKVCVYFKKLEDIDTHVLLKIVETSVEYMRRKYPQK